MLVAQAKLGVIMLDSSFSMARGIYTRHGSFYDRHHNLSPASADAATKPARKLFIRTFGCQMNEYDSEKMADILNQDRPVELTTNPEEADIILFNTCSVREKAQERCSRIWAGFSI